MDNREQVYRNLIAVCERNKSDSRWLNYPVIRVTLHHTRLPNNDIKFHTDVKVRLYNNGRGIFARGATLEDALDLAHRRALVFEQKFLLRQQIQSLKIKIREYNNV